MLFEFVMMDFRDFISNMQEYGVYDVLLPFLLIFSFMYALLDKTAIFGKVDVKIKDKEGKDTGQTSKQSRHSINAVVAFVVGALVVSQTNIVGILNTFLPRAALFIIVVLMILVMYGMTANTSGALSGIPLGFAIIACLVAVILMLGPTVAIPEDIKEILIRFGIPIGVIALLIWLLVRNPSKKEPKPGILRALEKIGAGTLNPPPKNP